MTGMVACNSVATARSLERKEVPMSIRRKGMATSVRVLALGALIVLATLGVTNVASGGALVFKDFGCHTDPGDVPGFGEIPMPNQTAILLPDGGVKLICTGTLPDGATLDRTIVREIPCNIDPPWANTTGQLVATKSGQVQFKCTFAPPA
jgi:hypothetical protein